MKSSILFLLITCSIVAQEPPREEGSPPPKNGQGKPRHPLSGILWEKADSNHDDKISKDEFFALPRIAKIPEEKRNNIFTRVDKNADGFITKEELPKPPYDGPPPDGGPRGMGLKLKDLDTNQDKKISFDEFQADPMITKLPEPRRKKIFERMDRNHDGFLSPEDRPKDGPPPHDKMPPRAKFEDLDANKDGTVDFPEFQHNPPLTKLSEDEQENRFMSLDKNNDHKLSAEEYNPKMEAPPKP